MSSARLVVNDNHQISFISQESQIFGKPDSIMLPAMAFVCAELKQSSVAHKNTSSPPCSFKDSKCKIIQFIPIPQVRLTAMSTSFLSVCGGFMLWFFSLKIMHLLAFLLQYLCHIYNSEFEKTFSLSQRNTLVFTQGKHSTFTPSLGTAMVIVHLLRIVAQLARPAETMHNQPVELPAAHRFRSSHAAAAAVACLLLISGLAAETVLLDSTDMKSSLHLLWARFSTTSTRCNNRPRPRLSRGKPPFL